MYLLDTNIVSELRKNKPHGAMLAWVSAADDATAELARLGLGSPTSSSGGVFAMEVDDPGVEGWRPISYEPTAQSRPPP